VACVEEARAVLARLERIEELEHQDVPAEVLLGEVRALLTEAEAWVRAEPAGTDRAVDSIDRCRIALGELPAEGSEVLGRKSKA
jgi:hypothetical protein